MNRKRLFLVVAVIVAMSGLVFAEGASEAEAADTVQVERQQLHYQDVHPLPFFDFSIPRSVYIQIYEVATTQAYSTYSIIESVTGTPRFYGESIGYGIPADTSLTNPLQPGQRDSSGDGYIDSYVIEQPEPNGLYSSKNTDGTWVLFVQPNGDITPVYTEHKVTTFPFAVRLDSDGLWVRSDNQAVPFTVDPERRE